MERVLDMCGMPPPMAAAALLGLVLNMFGMGCPMAAATLWLRPPGGEYAKLLLQTGGSTRAGPQPSADKATAGEINGTQEALAKQEPAKLTWAKLTERKKRRRN